MKKIAWVLVIVFACSFLIWSSAYSRMNPYNYRDVYVNGDDHTWGGENGFVPDDSPINDDGTITGGVQYQSFFDILFWKYVAPSIFDLIGTPGINTKPNITIKQIPEQPEEKPVEPNPVVIRNH